MRSSTAICVALDSRPWPAACAPSREGPLPRTALPAAFVQSPASIENDPEKLFGAGWGVITRSARGLGFEKAGEFSALDFDVVEELRCKCEPRRGKVWKHDALVNVKLAWKPGAAPVVTARLE